MTAPPPAASTLPRLLLVNAPEESPAGLADALARHFDMSTATSGQQALARLAQASAEVVVAICPLPDLSDEEFCGQLQGLAGGQPGLCVMMVADASSSAAIAMLRAGADECLPLGINPQELVPRLEALLRCGQRQRELNPLTGLPGNAYLEREVSRGLPDRGGLAVTSFDLEDFKAYNDVYGYYRGDQVIKLVARILGDAVSRHGQPPDCLAHIGGDDFFVVTSPQRMHEIAGAAIAEFEQAIGELYDDEDRRRGGIVSFTRRGQEVFFPLMRLIAVAATNEAAEIEHVGQIAHILAELKGYAKQTGASSLVVDRRRVHDARRT